jgi:mycofactocin system glycosyltransferase
VNASQSAAGPARPDCGPATPGFPTGLPIVLDAATREVAPGALLGGSPRRVLRLSSRGRSAWSELRAGRVGSAASRLLARRLTDAGLAHPRPADAEVLDLTVVVPAYDRPDLLAACLAGLGDRYPVVVVDDGSTRPDAVAAVAAEHGAALLRRDANGGPAAARNLGLSLVTTEFVGFVDSDCLPSAGWAEALAGHFRDPLVAAVAPRIVPAAPGPRYREAVGLLDLGGRPGRVRPRGRIGHVPTAALLARTAALRSVGSGFDERLRYGEDVDLVWRLEAAGWRVRYDPSVVVAHREPSSWPARLAKRFRYGSSAAALSQRHPGALAPLVVAPLPMAAVLGALTRRLALLSVGIAGTTAVSARAARRSGLPLSMAPRFAAGAVGASWTATGRAATQFGVPVLLAGLRRRGPESRRRAGARRLAIAALLVSPAVAARRQGGATHLPVSLPRFVAGYLLDDLAYGAGVIAGCLRDHTTAPLRPVRSTRHEVG